jgi:DNA-binding NtrC family response regulator
MNQGDGMSSETAVLCVDDEPHVLSALHRTLGGEPYEVLGAAAGAEALRILEGYSVKVVISDQRMAGMSGSELLKEIRRRKPGVGLIILTGYGGPDTMISGLEARVDFVMPKPWDEDRLRLVIRGLLHEVKRFDPIPRSTDPASDPR